MGNPQSKEKKRIIEAQRSQASEKVTGVVAEEGGFLDSPHFSVLQEFPLYLRFFCPSAESVPLNHEAIKTNLMQAAELKTIVFPENMPGNEVSVLLPLYLKNAVKLEKLVLRGIQNLGMSLLVSSLFVASPSLREIDLEFTKLEGCQTRHLVSGLLQYAEEVKRDESSPTLRILAERGNPFFCQDVQMSVKFNEWLASQAEVLESKYGIVLTHPSIPETPFEINGKWVCVSEVNPNVPIASTYVSLITNDFSNVADGETKADFLAETISVIIRAQRSAQPPEGLRYIPRLFHLQKYSRELFKIAYEDPTRQQNFVAIGELFSEKTADQWTVTWRLEVVLQIAQVCSFMHSIKAGLREIYPRDILVDMRQKRILYTELSSLRPSGLQTQLHREKAADRLRFADPSENNRSDFTLPKDLYSLGMSLLYFLVPTENQKQLKNSYSPPFNPSNDLAVSSQHYLKLLESNPATAALKIETKQQIAELVAESTMKQEVRRPTATAFAERLRSVVNDIASV